MIAVAFLVAACVGAVLRALITSLEAPFDRQMRGTILVNVVGAFLLGLLHGVEADTAIVLGVGGIGSLTTFSTFVSQIECIDREGRRSDAALYLVSSVVLGILAGWVGWSLS